MLKLAGVTKRFGARVVLNAVSLEVAPGEYVAIVGESGIGTSMVRHVIAGRAAVDSGSVESDGAEITPMDDDSGTLRRRERFGFVFQAFHVLPHLSVLQNVGLPLLLRGVKQADLAKRAGAIVAAVGLAGREESMPRELSGGELQRVAIARALVGDPQLVLADEPTGNLDPKTADQVLELLLEMNRVHGTALVVVTHSPDLALRLGRRVELVDGVLVEALNAEPNLG